MVVAAVEVAVEVAVVVAVVAAMVVVVVVVVVVVAAMVVVVVVVVVVVAAVVVVVEVSVTEVSMADNSTAASVKPTEDVSLLCSGSNFDKDVSFSAPLRPRDPSNTGSESSGEPNSP